jgi:hypothetical protein
MRSFTALAALLGVASTVSSQPLYLTRDGAPEAVIVDGGTPEGCRSAAEELRHYIQLMSGAELGIAADPVAGKPNVFVGGRTAFERLAQTPEELGLGREGFVVRTVGSDLVLAGARNISTLYAVCDFLEDDLGCHWFWPGELGEVVPRRPSIQVDRLDRIERPSFRIRWVGGQEWALKNRMNVGTGEPDGFNIHWFVHTWLNLVPPAQYADEHPEYYSEVGGERLDPKGARRVNLCTTNPEVAQAAARTIEEVMDERPATDMISVDPEDTQQFCQCEQCRAKYEDAQLPYELRNSRRVFDFTNQVAGLVAQEHPDLVIKTIAYHTYVRPPPDADWRPRDNVAVQFCRFMCHNHALGDGTCPHNQGFDAWYREWRGRTRNVLFYEYYWKVSWVGLPWPINRMLRADLPRFRDDGLLGIATQFSTNHATNGLGYWLASKLLWDADADVDALLETYYTEFFGEAAPHVRAYYDDLDRAAEASGVHLAEQRPYADILTLFTPDLIDRLDAHLRAAQAAAQGDQVRERVRMLQSGMQYTRLVVDYLRAIQSAAGGPGDTLWAGALANRMDEVKATGEPLAEAIREFLLLPGNADALDQPNNYTNLLLNPEGAVRQLFAGAEGEVALTKTQWLEARGNKPVAREVPERFAIWVYGNDLDFHDGRPEHALSLRGPDGEWEVVGGVGTAEANGDGRNVCFVVPGLESARYLGDVNLEIRFDNTPGGPYASHVYGIWLMADEPGLAPQEATRWVEEDIESVREASLGFTEYTYSGFLSEEDAAELVPMEVVVQSAE